MSVDYRSNEHPALPVLKKEQQSCSLPPEGEFVTVKEALFEARNAIDCALKKLPERLGDDTPLRKACLYALKGGKRFRAAVVLLLVQALGSGREVIDAAVAIECFHAASLIADDLPCMDDDNERRDKPSVHKAFGESTALLASYTLIAMGYELLSDAAEKLHQNGVSLEESARCCQLSVRSVSQCTGIQGACGGQYLDLFPPNYDEATLREILDRKTVTLFEISFVLGWLYGGGPVERLQDLKKLAYHFGMAFQIVDDLGDLEQDSERQGAVNLALAMGAEKAIDTLRDELNAYNEQLKALGLDNSKLIGLGELLLSKIPENLIPG